MDTGMFRQVTDHFIAQTRSRPPSDPPLADFPESEAVRDLTEVQNEAREHLKNILLLTSPPKAE